ncbi:MAG: hydroxymethylglutaryl-CoA synthase, partial [Pseudomonadota bacterium]
QAQNDARLIEAGMVYNREVGNCYAASLYLSLISMLENCEDDLTGRPVGMFSYGSGAVAEFFSALVQPGYRDHLLKAHHTRLLEDRTALSYDEYLAFRHAPDPVDGSEAVMAQVARGHYRLARIHEHKRHYEAV